MKKVRRNFYVTGALFLLFAVLTVSVMKVDVRPIGPENSYVGLGAVNQFVFERLGVNMLWYGITDWLGVTAVLTAFGFAVLGMIQLIRRRSIFKVDADLIVLGLFYLLVIGAYIFFEFCVVNYRPVLMNGRLEPSFPSSHTMIVFSIMAAAMMQFHDRIKNKAVRAASEFIPAAIIAVTILGRLISGVHWCTDIAAGILLGAAFAMLYWSVRSYLGRRDSR